MQASYQDRESRRSDESGGGRNAMECSVVQCLPAHTAFLIKNTNLHLRAKPRHTKGCRVKLHCREVSPAGHEVKHKQAGPKHVEVRRYTYSNRRKCPQDGLETKAKDSLQAQAGTLHSKHKQTLAAGRMR